MAGQLTFSLLLNATAPSLALDHLQIFSTYFLYVELVPVPGPGDLIPLNRDPWLQRRSHYQFTSKHWPHSMKSPIVRPSAIRYSNLALFA